MRTQFSLLRHRSGIFYLIDKATRRRTSLKTRDLAEAQKLVQTHNDVAAVS